MMSVGMLRARHLLRINTLVAISTVVGHASLSPLSAAASETRDVRIGDVTLYIPPDFGFSVRLRANGQEPKRFGISRNQPIPDELKAAAGAVPRVYKITMGNCGRHIRERPPMELPGIKNLK